KMKAHQRSCRLLYTKSGRGEALVTLLEGEIPQGLPTIEITLEEFRAACRRHGLSFRLKYPEIERRRLRGESLSRYRSSPRYLSRRVQTRRERAGLGPLSAVEREEIRTSSAPLLTLARRFKLSLRQIDDIRKEAAIAA